MPGIRDYTNFDPVLPSDALVVDRTGVGTGYILASEFGLTPTGVTPGDYTNTNITVNVYGQITNISNGGSGQVVQHITSSPTSPGPDVNPLADIVYVTSSGSGGAEYVNVPNPSQDITKVGHILAIQYQVKTDPADRVHVYAGASGTLYPISLVGGNPNSPPSTIDGYKVIDGAELANVGEATAFLASYGGLAWAPYLVGWDSSETWISDNIIIEPNDGGTGIDGAYVHLWGGVGGLGASGGLVDIRGGQTGASGGGAQAGDVNITGGEGAGTASVPGNINITGGTATDGDGGDVNIVSGPGGASGTTIGGAIALTTADGTGANGGGGPMRLYTGVGMGTAEGGSITLLGGVGGNAGGAGGAVLMSGGAALSTGKGGAATITAGTAVGSGDGGDAAIAAGNSNGAGNGGDLFLSPGEAEGAGVNGHVILRLLPTADPHVVNALWNSSGAIHISAG